MKERRSNAFGVNIQKLGEKEIENYNYKRVTYLDKTTELICIIIQLHELIILKISLEHANMFS